MEGILNNDLIIIPNIKKTIKDLISYFWQPSMDNTKRYYNNQQPEYNKPNRNIDKKERLSLNNIMMLTIGKEDAYMITLQGLKQSNCDDRILLRNGMKEITIIEQCIKNNTYLERKNIKEYMPSDYIDIYNEALNEGYYDRCLTMLRGIELQINKRSREKNEIKKSLIKGRR